MLLIKKLCILQEKYSAVMQTNDDDDDDVVINDFHFLKTFKFCLFKSSKS